MKPLIRSILVIIVAVSLMLVGRNHLETSRGVTGDKVVNFYNWGDYIDPELLTQFEEETGYVVVYETFDSNEAMVTKIQQGGTNYDLIGPSEYMVESMVEQDLLMPINKDLLPNLPNIDPRFMDQAYDPGNKYSIPYFWGTLGILYNTNEIEEGEITGWKDLWDEKYRESIMVYDGARETMGIGLQSLGYSLNDTDYSHMVEAMKKMKTLMPNIQALLADEIKMYAVMEQAPIAVTFSGEAAMAMDDNEDLAYIIPEEGTNIWYDTLAIPKNAKNIEGAHALMDFLMRPDVAAQNAEYIGYATPNAKAKELMDPEITSDPAFYPSDELISKMEIYKNLGQENLIKYNDLYLEIKLEPR